MFENVGGKLKMLAKIFFWLTTVVSVILAFTLGYDSYYDELLPSFWAYLLGGPIVAYIYALVFYAFGELVDRATSIDKKIAGEETPAEEAPTEAE